ncbi:hypothetical protein chiPu_0013043 [Chiloscyllium punctatum]|uniref:Uncharacterized protein n=1 Tax=Chiloscyllium punctatum TaxID=137246 RepID=A0A401SW16_CHIPU|nr:hypothetical protein [Chiloscyllium punctatum]
MFLRTPLYEGHHGARAIFPTRSWAAAACTRRQLRAGGMPASRRSWRPGNDRGGWAIGKKGGLTDRRLETSQVQVQVQVQVRLSDWALVTEILDGRLL